MNTGGPIVALPCPAKIDRSHSGSCIIQVAPRRRPCQRVHGEHRLVKQHVAVLRVPQALARLPQLRYPFRTDGERFEIQHQQALEVTALVARVAHDPVVLQLAARRAAVEAGLHTRVGDRVTAQALVLEQRERVHHQVDAARHPGSAGD